MNEIELTQGQVAIVSDCDFEAVSALKWSATFRPRYKNGAFIARHSISGKSPLSLHRFILSRALGRQLTRSECVDHINGNTLDNRRENLRLASVAQNNINKATRGNRIYKGVERCKTGWSARIWDGEKKQYLGFFKTAEDAARSYDKAAVELHGEFARLNIPQ